MLRVLCGIFLARVSIVDFCIIEDKDSLEEEKITGLASLVSLVFFLLFLIFCVLGRALGIGLLFVVKKILLPPCCKFPMLRVLCGIFLARVSIVDFSIIEDKDSLEEEKNNGLASLVSLVFFILFLVFCVLGQALGLGLLFVV